MSYTFIQNSSFYRTISVSSKEEFNCKGFTVVSNAIDASDLWKYVQTKVDEGNNNDKQCPGNPSFYNDLEMSKTQIKLLRLMEQSTGLQLYPTYNYFRLYKHDAYLDKHTDRPACEISASLCLGYLGEKWNLWIEDLTNKSAVESILEPGDILIYKGCIAPHWREGKYKGRLQGQAFMHYVDQNGPYADCIFDVIKPQ